MNTSTESTNFAQEFKDLGLFLNMSSYASLTKDERKKAWNSFLTWVMNPYGGKSVNLNEIISILRPAVKSKYFCPISDKDLILEILKPTKDRQSNECFIMLRLSQNKRPLVFVCALGRSRIWRIRIGLPTDSNPEYTVLDKEGDIIHHNSDIEVIIQELINSYAEGLTVHKWSEVSINNDQN